MVPFLVVPAVGRTSSPCFVEWSAVGGGGSTVELPRGLSRMPVELLREGGGVLDVMDGCSRMAIDPRIHTMPGRSTSGGGVLITCMAANRMAICGGG